LGLDSRESTPELVRVSIHLVAELRSFDCAAKMMKLILGHAISGKTFERLASQVGDELAKVCDDDRLMPAKQVVVPDVAVVSCDGGRIHTREPGHGPGVHGARWRETKNASFEKMTSPAVSDQDPCESLPETFRRVAHVAKIAEKAAFSVDCVAEPRPPYEGPERVLRTCVSSMKRSRQFGPRMRREARRRRFFEARRRVFVGDGLPWNWSIWKKHFKTFTPILDFIHAVQYLYAAADAYGGDDASRWSQYLRWAEAVWQGRTADVIAELRAELDRRGAEVGEESSEDDEETARPATGPDGPLVDAARYLQNNLTRMDYPRYRRQGLPITSAPMESLIKQINHRVKGTEMFWNDPTGAEPILQIRSASLSEDGRLDDYLRQRPGCHWVRRSTQTLAA
jgi:hypothetical protein